MTDQPTGWGALFSGRNGTRALVLAGVPFGTPGSTNLLHVVSLSGDELKGR